MRIDLPQEQRWFSVKTQILPDVSPQMLMKQKFWLAILAGLLLANPGSAITGYAQEAGTVNEETSPAPAANTEETSPSPAANAVDEAAIATIKTHQLAGSPAATIYVRGIPVLTFTGTKGAAGFEENASAVANQINQLAKGGVDANQITASWNGDRQIYAIQVNRQTLVEMDGKAVRLPDTTKNPAQDALQATNRLRRLLGNAAPLAAIPGAPQARRTATNKPSSQANSSSNPKPSRVRATSTGMASWYGPGDDGGTIAANGERINHNKLTAAHKRLPFGTRVRVTNLRNNRSIVVRINDRGPFVRGRVIDLTRAGARALGMIGSGVAPVRLEVLD
jgi:rare lipoprotein A